MPRIPVAPAVLLMLDVAIALASVPPSLGHEALYDTVLYPLNGVVLGLAGLLILSRHRRHAIGVLMAGLGLLAVLTEFTEGYGYHPEWPAAQLVQWSSQWTSIVGASATAIILLLFPDGRVPGPRWRPLLWLAVASVVLTGFAYAFGHAADDAYTSGANPYAIDGPVIPVLAVIGNTGFALSILGAVAALVLRFRRAGGTEREQLKWVAYVVLWFVIVGPAAIFFYFGSVLVRVAIALVVVLWPIAICVAILRYRLYEIDRLISRTIGYVALTVAVAGTYAAIALGLGGLLGGRHDSYVTAAATLAAAAVFLPLRTRIQDVVDHRFRRRRYDALARIDAFLASLRAGQAAPEELEGVLRDVLRIDLTLRYLLPDGRAIDSRGDLHPESDQLAAVSVERNGVRLAAVTVAAPDDDEPGLLADVLERAGLAIEIARLRAEVNHQLAQVQASRARIVSAGIEERRRLERDLHDGAQQSLVSAGLTLRLAQYQLDEHGGDPAVGEHLDSAVTQIAQAISELRELANGIRPARLDAGLRSALSDLAGRMQLPIDVSVGEERYPPDIEATAYFVACEALTNVAKYAQASAVTVQAAREEEWLVLTVADDGAGGAVSGGGSGLRGLVDRVAAVGGRLNVESPPGIGTTLVARLPCG